MPYPIFLNSFLYYSSILPWSLTQHLPLRFTNKIYAHICHISLHLQNSCNTVFHRNMFVSVIYVQIRCIKEIINNNTNCCCYTASVFGLHTDVCTDMQTLRYYTPQIASSFHGTDTARLPKNSQNKPHMCLAQVVTELFFQYFLS
jgi:hypothetical protein